MTIPESHLAQEAIAALVDGELPSGPAARAARHLSGCLQCRLAVEAQREAKAALHASADVDVPGDLLSRLRAIPFTTDVPGTVGWGTVAADAGQLTLSGTSGSWSVPLTEQRRPQRADHARWLRRGLAGTLAGLGVGVTALALNLPADGPARAGTASDGTSAGRSATDMHTEVAPPVVRTLSVGTSSRPGAPGGTP